MNWKRARRVFRFSVRAESFRSLRIRLLAIIASFRRTGPALAAWTLAGITLLRLSSWFGTAIRTRSMLAARIG
jgi:hypothetical protein